MSHVRLGLLPVELDPCVFRDEAGRMRLAFAARESASATPSVFLATWSDTGWADVRRLGHAARVSPAALLTARGARGVAWVEPGDGGGAPGRLCALRFDAGAKRETVSTVLQQSSGFAAASTAGRDWIARSEQRPGKGDGFVVRVFSRGGEARWREDGPFGEDEFTCAIAPLAGDTAIVAHAGAGGLVVRTVPAGGTAAAMALDPRPRVAAHPRLAPTSDGGTWLLWTEKTAVRVARLRAGAWTAAESLAATHPDRGTYWSAWCAIACDPRDRPVAVWGERGYGATERDVLCFAEADDGKWSAGVEIPGSDGAFIPSAARDARGATWVAWWDARARAPAFTRTLPATPARGGGR